MSHISPRAWIILLPQLPPHPSSLRVRVWRRLQQIGAVAVKNAAYALPDTEAALEDFTWLRQEIVDAGGGALLLRAQGVGEADREIEQLFRDERDAGYRKLTEEMQAFTAVLREEKELESPDFSGAGRALRQFTERLETIRGLDFFGAAGSAAAEEALLEARAALQARQGLREPQPGEEASAAAPRGGLWATRAGVYVDRLACAWMIRRFVDADARFLFLSPGTSPPEGATPFDMAGVEFGHHGAACSVETLARRYRPQDAALRSVAEVVHDLDLKDEGFGRPEAAGLKRLLDGICALTGEDGERVRLAAPLFDALYAGFA